MDTILATLMDTILAVLIVGSVISITIFLVFQQRLPPRGKH
ncbi:MAG TPA: hypothetical protein VFC02_02860 [Anaerolineales bacterium]|jgi:hypothetical protein|nr:hypothetical protein [Anaerolineales bacterium]